MTNEITTFVEFSEILSSNNYIIIDCYADWCGPCKKMEPYVEQFAEKYVDVKFYKINIENKNLKQIVDVLQVTSLPTFCLFEKGEYVANYVGASVDGLDKWIQDKVGW